MRPRSIVLPVGVREGEVEAPGVRVADPEGDVAEPGVRVGVVLGVRDVDGALVDGRAVGVDVLGERVGVVLAVPGRTVGGAPDELGRGLSARGV